MTGTTRVSEFFSGVPAKGVTPLDAGPFVECVLDVLAYCDEREIATHVFRNYDRSKSSLAEIGRPHVGVSLILSNAKPNDFTAI